MKILHCSDAHHDWKTGGVRRAEEVEEAFDQTVRTAIAEEVDAYVFTGDLSDPDDGPAALAAATCAISVALRLDAAGIPSFWLAGNHDVVEDGSGRSTLSPLRALAALTGRVRVFDRPALVALPGKPKVARGAPARLLALPYPSLANAYDPKLAVEQAVRACGEGGQVVVATHLQFEGMHAGEESTEMARGREVRFPVESVPPGWLTIAGHYHDGETIERAGRQIRIAGSLVRLTHGEERNRPRYLIHEV